MAKYVDQQARNRARKRKQKKARRMAMYSCIVLFVLVVSFVITQVIQFFTREEDHQPLLDNPGNTQTELTDTPSPVDYAVGPHISDLSLPLVQPDISHTQATANGRVDVGYFDDAIFMGDSLADGFKDYAAWMSLKGRGTLYLTQRSMTPRSFMQPGAMVDAGDAGVVDVWATIADRQPGKMYITLGTNALMAMDPAEFIESYYQLVAKIRQTSPNTTIYITTIPPTSSAYAAKEERLSKERIQQANDLIAKMCREENLALINLYDVVMGADGYLNEEINSDGIHMTPEGYKMWLNYLIEHTVYSPDSPYIPGSPYHSQNLVDSIITEQTDNG
ncbi:MAG: hypothetical protein IKY30_01675 [Oscillospiraceae bacterium]|nr:hypothetical protein [Oscillospiraceae bacterium]